MKKVLVLTGKPSARDCIRESVAGRDIDVKLAAYEELAFLIDSGIGKAWAYTDEGVLDFSDFDKFFLVTTPKPTYRHIWASIQCFLRMNQKQMIDDEVAIREGKLYEMWRLFEEGVSVPATAFGPADFLVETLETRFDGIGVLKDIFGTQGSNNYLVRSGAEIREIVARQPEIQFVLQEFIPNDGDYRIVCFNYEPRMGIRRWSDTGDHRNNTSLGGKSEIIEVSDAMREVAIPAAKAMGLRFVGVDLVQHKETGKFYVLETNQTPQLTSGAQMDEKKKLIGDFLEN